MSDPLQAPTQSFSDPREAPRIERSEAYIPELPYVQNGYNPIGKRFYVDDESGEKIYTMNVPKDQFIQSEGPEEHFCNRCVEYYKKLATEGLYPKGPWSLPCQGDLSWRMRQYENIKPEELDMSEEEFSYFLLSLDPIRWAEYEFGLKLDWYQGAMMNCSNPWKAVRGGRRIGKTTVLGLDILYALFTKFGVTKPRYEYLIICPYEAQVKKIFDNLEALISVSVNLKASVKGVRKSPHWELELHNGAIARGFSSGKKTGARSEKIRGQDADAIGFDEIDYMADDDIEAIFAVLGSQQNVRLWMSTTPTGARSKFWRCCTDKTQGFKEFWFISNESPRWTPHAEKFFKSMYSQGGYDREFNAEFGTPTEGVFRQDDLDQCLREYEYEDCTRHPERKVVIGVDWNKLTGTHIVAVEGDYKKKSGARFAVVDKKIIRPQEFTQLAGIDAVIEMDRKWHADYIYVDEGYGATQVELLHRIDRQMPMARTGYAERVVAVNMSTKIEFRDPRNPGLSVKKAAKPFMVDMLSGWVGAHQIILPAFEDSDISIIESEIAYLDIGLVQQMREFKVEKVSPTGQVRYTQGYEHTLTALALACMGHALRFSEMNQNFVDERVIYHDYAFGEKRDETREEEVDTKNKKARRRNLREELKPNRNVLERPKKTVGSQGIFGPMGGAPKSGGFYNRPSAPTRRIP